MTKKNKYVGRDELLMRLLNNFPRAVAIKALNKSDFYVKPYTDDRLSDEITDIMQEIVSDLPYTCEKTNRDPFFIEDNDLHPEYLLKYNATDRKKSNNNFFYENGTDWAENIFVFNYFLETYDKVAIQLFSDGIGLFVKPYHKELTPEEIESKVLADLDHKKINIRIIKNDTLFINDLDDSPEISIDFLEYEEEKHPVKSEEKEPLIPENPHFESILKKVNNSSIPDRRKKIDDFLVEIGYLPPNDDPNDYWSREWDIEYNKFTLALPLLKTFEEFDQFHEYVWIKMAGSIMGSDKHFVIWENKALWMEKYLGSGLAE